jgi:hypothetical protein
MMAWHGAFKQSSSERDAECLHPRRSDRSPSTTRTTFSVQRVGEDCIFERVVPGLTVMLSLQQASFIGSVPLTCGVSTKEQRNTPKASNTFRSIATLEMRR